MQGTRLSANRSKQSFSEVKMARGSPICKKLRLKNVEQFQNDVPQCRIVKTLNISLSTVHNIINRKSKLDACDIWALKQRCITNLMILLWKSLHVFCTEFTVPSTNAS